MPRPSKSAERVVLRRYAKAAGGRDALIGWIDAALSETQPQRGRKRYSERYSIALIERLAEANPKDRVEIFQQLIDEGRIGGIGTKKSIVQRATRNFRKGEKKLIEMVSKFKEAFDQFRFTDHQLAQLRDSIRARIESQQRVKARGYPRPQVTQPDGKAYDTSGSRTPSPPERTRSRQSRRSSRPKLSPVV
jgi:hypothetical protein